MTISPMGDAALNDKPSMRAQMRQAATTTLLRLRKAGVTTLVAAAKVTHFVLPYLMGAGAVVGAALLTEAATDGSAPVTMPSYVPPAPYLVAGVTTLATVCVLWPIRNWVARYTRPGDHCEISPPR